MTPPAINYASSRLILLGTSVYDDRKFRNVPAAETSLRGMREALGHTLLGGWPEERIVYLHNQRNANEVLKRVRKIARETKGALVFYFVGHGAITQRGELCLILADTEYEHPDLTGLEYRHLRDTLVDSGAAVKAVILDCCYSGRAVGNGLSGDDVPEITQIQGAYTLTASNMHNEIARWAEPTNGALTSPTSFTGELLTLVHEGLKGRDAELTIEDFYPTLQERLERRGLPRPDKRETGMGGRFRFTRNAALIDPQEAGGLPSWTTPPRRDWRRPARLALRTASRREFLLTGSALAVGGAIGGYLASRSTTSPATKTNVISGRQLGSAIDGQPQVWAVATAQLPGQPVALSAGDGGLIQVWDLKTRTQVRAGMQHPPKIHAICVTSAPGHQGPVVVSGATDGTLKMWDLATQQLIADLPHQHTAQIWRVAAIADGTTQLAITGSDDGTTRVWDLGTRKPFRTGQLTYSAKVFSVATGTMDTTPVAVTGASDQTVRVWDLRTLRELQDMTTDSMNVVQSVATGTVAGQLIALSGECQPSFYVRRWNLTTGQETGAPMIGHTDWVWDIAIGQLRGKPVAVSVGDGIGRIWDLTTDALEATLEPQKSSMWGVALTKSGSHTTAVTACLDGTVSTFDLGPTEA